MAAGRAKRSWIYGLCAVLFLSGCAPNASQVSHSMVEVPAVYLEGGEAAVPAASPGRWWEQFDDPRLDALMEEMLAHNLDVAQAFARLAQLQDLARVSDAGLLPFLNFEAQGSRDRQPSSLGDATGNNYRMALAAGYELDLWQKIRSRSRAAHHEVQASREDVKTLYISLTAQLADLYYLAVEQRAQLTLADNIIAILEDSLARVERRYREGLVSSLDVYQARQNLLEAQESRPQFAKTLAQTNHGIALLLGRVPEKQISGSLATLPETMEAFPAGLPAQLLTRRPDIKAQYLRLAAQDARTAAAIADRFPAVNLLANFGRSRSEYDALVTTGTFWSMLADLAMPIIDGGRRKAEVDRNRAAFNEELARYRQTVLRAVNEVEDALVSSDATERRLYFLRERTRATAASLRLATSDYFAGLSDYLSVLIAQRLHFSAQVQLLTAQRQLLSDRISLMRALGGDWMADQLQEHEAAAHRQGKTP